MNKLSEIEGIVLSVQDYKESDGIIKFLTKDGVISILAKGIRKQNSKNRMITQPFCKVKYTLDLKEDGLSLLYFGNIITYYYRIGEDLVTSSICFMLSECMIRAGSNDVIYYFFDQCLNSFQLGLIEAYTYACLVLKEIILKEGIAPYVDGCVICQKTDHLETLSLESGGFICTTCNHDRYLPRSKKEMIQIRSLFRVKMEDIDRFNEMYEFTVNDIIFWGEWFERFMQTTITSLSFLKSVQAFT